VKAQEKHDKAMEAATKSVKKFASVFDVVSTRFDEREKELTAGGAFFTGLFKATSESYGGQLSGVLDQQDADKKRRLEGSGSEGASETIKNATAGVADQQRKQDNDVVKSDAKKWGSLVSNALAGSKKLRKLHKALAIATTITNTAKGVMSALSGPPDGPPFPLNIAQAAFVAAMGAKQIAAIKGQAHAGIKNIPSTGTYLLEQGERVVGSRLNKDLSDYLAREREGSAGGAVTNAPVINMTFGADTDENTVAGNRGAVESMIRDIFADYGMHAPFA